MCRLMTHRRSVKIGLEFWNRIRNDKYEVRSKYEQIWANMSKYEVHRTSWGNGEKGDWGLEIGSGAFICFANVFFIWQFWKYFLFLKVLNFYDAMYHVIKIIFIWSKFLNIL